MKTVELMDYEFSGLLSILRDSLHQENTLAVSSDPDRLHGLNAHLIVHLLEVLQPKHPAISIPVMRQERIPQRMPELHDLSLTSVAA